MHINRIHGDSAERFVAQHMIDQGYTILARNFNARVGEIDIIAQKHDLIACIEVKMRNNPAFDLTYLITQPKQRKIVATARLFLAQQKLEDVVCRFDVALVTHYNDTWSLEYIADAFQSEDE